MPPAPAQWILFVDTVPIVPSIVAELGPLGEIALALDLNSSPESRAMCRPLVGGVTQFNARVKDSQYFKGDLLHCAVETTVFRGTKSLSSHGNVPTTWNIKFKSPVSIWILVVV